MVTVKDRITPTQRAIDELCTLGYKLISAGGSGFILPRYWIFKRPDGTDFIACKTKTLTKELNNADSKGGYEDGS